MFESADLINEAVKAFVGKVVEKTFDLFTDKIKTTVKVNIKEYGEIFEQRLILHINELYNWSSFIEFIGLGKPIYTNQTIDLKYYYSSIEYTRNSNNHDLKSEDELLNEKEHICLLGDPGSGKTTTLKRLINNRFFTSEYESLPYSFPILVRFRAIDSTYDLYSYLANLFGIDYESKVEKYNIRVERRIEEEVEVRDLEKKWVKKKIVRNVDEIEQRERVVNYFGNVKLETFITQLIEDNRILLIMDGFDEINPVLSDTFEHQIKELSLKLFHSKLILTSRPNYIKNVLPGCNVFYIRELSRSQIESITQLWLKDYSDFIQQLQLKSYRELTNRPLFLCFLILLYNEGYLGVRKQLPKFSKDVYYHIIELLIIKWDDARDIHRLSVYGLYFDQTKKLDFLTHLAFELTYIIEEKVFTHETFVQAYISIHELFDLPKSEAEIVAEELENHTGIIIKTLYNKYEFSHLALQEYLCAKYMVNAKLNASFGKLLSINPVPFALVVCLSSDPVSWFYEIAKNICELNGPEYRNDLVKIFLSRLWRESPNFKTQDKLGIAVLKLSTASNCTDNNFVEILEKFISSNYAVRNSIKNVFGQYMPNGDILSGNNQIIYIRRQSSLNDFFPYSISLPISTDRLIWDI